MPCGRPLLKASRSGGLPVNDWVWVHHAPPANSSTSWGKPVFRRRRNCAMDRAASTVDGDLRPMHQSPFIPDGSWFDRLGSTWAFSTGLQPGMLRRPTSCSIWPMARRSARGRRRAGHRSRRRRCSGRPNGSNIRRRGADILELWIADPILVKICIGGKLIMLCRSSPTISRDGCRGWQMVHGMSANRWW